MGYRLPGEVEQLEIMERLETAALYGQVVTVSFFKQKKDTNKRPVFFGNGRPYLLKVTRTVEPYAVEFTLQGHPVAYVVDRSPEDEKGPMYRTIRLDRVAISTTTQRPLMRTRSKLRRACQGLIDLALAKRTERAAAAH